MCDESNRKLFRDAYTQGFRSGVRHGLAWALHSGMPPAEYERMLASQVEEEKVSDDSSEATNQHGPLSNYTQVGYEGAEED